MPRGFAPSKKDGNHRRIARELEELGFAVADLASCGHGVPDLLVARNGKQLLVELKTDRGRMTDDEIEFFGRWPLGLAIVARCTEDVLLEFDMI